MPKSKVKKEAVATEEIGVQTSSENGHKAKNQEKRERIGNELAMEIDGLRVVLSEMVDRYRFEIEAGLLELSSTARGESRLAQEGKRLRTSTAEGMLTQIRDAGIKSKKGRAKDFHRLETLVAELLEQLPREQ